MRTFLVPGGMPRSIFENKYSRRKEDGTFQTWAERVGEVVEGNFSLDPTASPEDKERTLQLARAGVMPFSGRHLQHGDLDQKKKIGELFCNCTTAMFSFTKFWLLLKGSGVGRCYDSDLCRVNWDNMPNVRFVLEGPDPKTGLGGHPDYETWIESLQEAQHKYDSESEDVRWFTVEDSAEGWAKIVEILETAAWQGKHKDKLFIFDFSKVREKGHPILGQQGRPASGPVPLIRALLQVASIKGSGMRPWKQAMFIDHYLSDCVAVGGIRRSARIAVKSWRDRDIIDFIDIKRGGWLQTSNNSVGTDDEFWGQALTPAPSHARRVFEAMCSAGYFDGTGEPGALNLSRMAWSNKGIDKITAATMVLENERKPLNLHARTYEMMGSVLDYAKRKAFPFIVNPCAEILLAVWGGYCVIGDICLANAQGLDEVRDAARLMSQFLVRTNTMSFFYDAEVKRTNRIGVGLTGIHEFAWTHFGYNFWDLLDEEHSRPFWNFLAELREIAEEGAREYCEARGWSIPHTVTTIKPSGCRPWYALTSTTQGILTLEEMFEGHPKNEEWAEYSGGAEVFQGGETRRITKTYQNGRSPLVRVQMNYGLTVESTPEHPWFVKQRHRKGVCQEVGEWIPAMHLQPGDVLDVNLQVYTREEHSTLHKVNSLAVRMRSDASDILQPESMSPDLAWLLGYLWGDGAQSVSKYRLRFIDQNREHLEKARRVLKDQFGLSGLSIHPASQGRDAFTLEVGSKMLWHWMIRNDFMKLYLDDLEIIPRAVRSSSQEDILSFLAGLMDADGNVHVFKGRKKQFTLTTASASFAHHVQHVFWTVGVGVGCSHNTLGDNFQSEKSMYLMTSCSHADEKAFGLLRKHSLKLSAIEKEHPELPWSHQVTSSNCGVLGKIKSVEDGGFASTYDIEVEGNHWYFAGAVRSHNTISKVMACTEGAHLPAYAYYMRWVQFAYDAPEVDEHRFRGYPVKDISSQYPGRVVIGFPTSIPIADLMGEEVACASDPLPEQHFDWLRLLEKYWLGEGKNNQVSYCLAGGGHHLVLTSQGLQRIEKVCEGQVPDRQGDLQTILDRVENGIAPTLKARLSNGVEIIGTGAHRVLVVDEDLELSWRHLSDLQPGEVVVRRVGDNLWSGECPSLPPTPVLLRADGKRGNLNSLRTPSVASPKFGLFLGMLMSDGAISENGISLVSTDPGVTERFVQLVFDLYGLECSTHVDGRTDSLQVTQANSRLLVGWLEEVGVPRYHTHNRIPDCILKSPRSTVEAFIRGYTLDGYLSTQKGSVYVCTTVSEIMAKDLVSVFQNLGYDASLGSKPGRPFYFSDSNKGMGRDQYLVRISPREAHRFVEEIGFLEERKNVAVRDLPIPSSTKTHGSNSIPARVFQEHYYSHPEYYKGDKNLGNLIRAASKKMSLGVVERYFRDVEGVEKFLDPRLRFTEVQSVTESGDRLTFDISVDVSHEYVANSVVVHNTLKYDPSKVRYEEYMKAILQNQPSVRACSVMPQTDLSAYVYLPEEKISKEAYDVYVSNIRQFEAEAYDAEHLACASGICPIEPDRV